MVSKIRAHNKTSKRYGSLRTNFRVGFNVIEVSTMKSAIIIRRASPISPSIGVSLDSVAKSLNVFDRKIVADCNIMATSPNVK